jgi:hypothetical protein
MQRETRYPTEENLKQNRVLHRSRVQIQGIDSGIPPDSWTKRVGLLSCPATTPVPSCKPDEVGEYTTLNNECTKLLALDLKPKETRLCNIFNRWRTLGGRNRSANTILALFQMECGFV